MLPNSSRSRRFIIISVFYIFMLPNIRIHFQFGHNSVWGVLLLEPVYRSSNSVCQVAYWHIDYHSMSTYTGKEMSTRMTYWLSQHEYILIFSICSSTPNAIWNSTPNAVWNSSFSHKFSHKLQWGATGMLARLWLFKAIFDQSMIGIKL